MTARAAEYILVAGRTLPVVAKVWSNGIECLAVMEAPGRPRLVPVAVAQKAPGRSRPVLCCVDGERV